MTVLPDLRRLTISQTARRPTRAAIEAFDHVLFVLPEKASGKHLRGIPQGAQLKRVLGRSGSGFASSRLANGKATGITLALLGPGEAFAQLTWSRRIVAECRRDNAANIGVVTAGLSEDVRENALSNLTAAAEASAFKLPSFKSVEKPARRFSRFALLGDQPPIPIEHCRAQALGNDIARWFSALPPNMLDASAYRRAVQALAKEFGIGYRFLNEAKLEKLGAGAFLAVSQGNSKRDAGIIHLQYRPNAQTSADLALVGKGILFDTGGTNLKPFKGMLDMHMDMQGSAVALGTLIALAKLQVPYAVDAWLAVTENRLSPEAYKSQDVVRAANGKTIQVIHTDAEGRMVLADALAIAALERPGLIIDYATLTGTCVSALTERYSGVFSNRPAANALLRRAGVTSGERVWPFPMDSDYDEPLRSDIADIKQCSTAGPGDHIMAARFLSKFVPDEIPWLHVDLSAGQNKGGLAHIPSEVTGFGVKLTVELLRSHDPIEFAATVAQ